MTCLLLYYVWCAFEIELIAFFEFTVIVVVLLDSIVGQMNERLIYAFLTQCELVRTGTNVTFFEEIALLILQIAAIDEDPKSDIKFTFVN